MAPAVSPPAPSRLFPAWLVSGIMLTIAYGLLGLTFSAPLSHASIMQRCVLVDPAMARIWSVGNIEIGVAYLGVFLGMIAYFIAIFRKKRQHLTDLGLACIYLVGSFLVDYLCVQHLQPFPALLVGDAVIMTFVVIVSRQLWFQRLLGVFVPIIFLTCGIGHFLEGLSYWQLTYPFNVPWTMVTADIGFAVVVNSARFPAFIRGQDVVEELEATNRTKAMLEQQMAALQEAQAARHASEERFRATFEQAAVGLAHISVQGQFLRVNQKLCAILGYTQEALLAQTIQSLIHSDDLQWNEKQAQDVLAGTLPTYTLELRCLTSEHEVRWIRLTVSLVRDTENSSPYFLYVLEDISQRRHVEEQLQHTLKLDSIGRLAGGIAHDFNNLLTAILGFTEIAADKASAKPEVVACLHNVTHAGERAASLTSQLLAFARKQMIAPRNVDMNVLLIGLDKMLRRLIGENIDLIILPRLPIWEVRADPSQIEQVIVNLAVNARDAMPTGGKLTIETSNTTLDEAYSEQFAEVVPGEYVMVTVSDNGIGMPEDVKRHIFEPFFTTKPSGKGTGLGLATCYGIVKQSGGHMWVYSEPGKGTTFKVYLPRTTGADSLPPTVEQSVLRGGGETVLVVEDEALVLDFVVRTLRSQGYLVLAASSGMEALQTAEAHAGTIDLLVTDVVLPQMSGKVLADRLREKIPTLRVLYSSGYTDNTVVHQGIGVTEGGFLQKPYLPSMLARRVRQILDGDVTHL